MPFPLIPFLSGAALGSVLTYLLTHKSEVIELSPPRADAGDKGAADDKDDSAAAD